MVFETCILIFLLLSDFIKVFRSDLLLLAKFLIPIKYQFYICEIHNVVTQALLYMQLLIFIFTLIFTIRCIDCYFKVVEQNMVMRYLIY